MTSLIPAFGSVPSPADYRDIAFSAVAEPVDLPSEYFVDVTQLPIWHQRKIGACVGHATAKYKQKLDQIDEKKIVPLSARFVYGMCKCLDGYAGEGTYPRISMQVLYDYGCPTEDILPNDTTVDHETYVFQRNIEVYKQWFEAAKTYKISSYASVNVGLLDEIKSAIIAGNGMSTLVKVGAEWYSDANGVTWAPERILPVKPPATVISGHQVYVYGYKDAVNSNAGNTNDTKIFFMNSWSSDWGDIGKGWFWWSEYKSFVTEAYTAIDVPQVLLDEAHDLPPPTAFKYEFKANMYLGQRSTDIKALQKALQLDGVFPPDQETTGYYGAITAKAVLAFWKKYAIASWWEVYFLQGRQVGPKTLKKLNELYNK